MTVFRLQDDIQTALRQGQDWFVSNEYDTNEIIAIPDPNGGEGNEPTSIPSPFARMDLANTAFRYVNTLGNNAGAMYHKIVSDCLDVAEIFYNFHRFQIEIQIVEWDKVADLQALLNSNNIEHRKLAETLKMYMNNAADAQAFNFNHFQKFYLLKYQHQIIGGTSPLTLFYNTANDLSWSNIVFTNSDKAFDSELCTLPNRDKEFQIWLYGMRCYFPNFASTFRELSSYMDICLLKLQTLNNSLYNCINDLKSTSYNPIDYDAIGNGLMVVNGLPIFQSRPLPEGDPISSDFEIASVKYRGKRKPLVLQHGHRGKTVEDKPMIYYYAPYPEKTVVPYNDVRSLNQRTLPGLGNIVYPYLTVSDFLEPFLIRTNYPINKGRFFDGNYNNGSYPQGKGFLLPIKKTFFEYFDIADLQKTINGKPRFQLDSLGSGTTTATLRIPIVNGNYIELKREYQELDGGVKMGFPNLLKNEGCIIENQFGLGLFPCIKFEQKENPQYRIALIDREVENQYNLTFYNQDDCTIEILEKEPVRRNKKDASNIESNYYIINRNFDFIQLNINSNVRGLIIPFFLTEIRNKKFTFAIDFGTTNSHIEYCVDGETKPFDITEKDIQLTKLHLEDKYLSLDFKQTFDCDFIPQIIGVESEYHFPIRTVLSEDEKTDYEKNIFALANVNIPFTYEKNTIMDYNKAITNLKWSNEKENSKRVELFIDNILLLVRNKVILNGGKLADTKIVWFYPASMLEGRYDQFKQIWVKLFKNNFCDNTANLISMSESIAPYHYYATEEGATRNVVSVDIGGGSTDVIIFEEDKAKLLTSFRFAANSIFGDGFAYKSDRNGFVRDFRDEIINILDKNGLKKLIDVLRKIEQKKQSADIIAFFFSLANNKDVLAKTEIDFSQMLAKNEKYKIVFILFYTAILYHIAVIMKAKKMTMPRYLTFSGTGSKTLQILTPDNSKLESFSKLIFEKIFDEKYDKNGLTIIRNTKNPKEATCKGGLANPFEQSYDSIDNIKATLLGTDFNIFANNNTKYSSISKSDISLIESQTIKFIDFAFSLNTDFSFTKKFLADSNQLDYAKELCLKDIKQYIEDGLKIKQEELKKTDSNQNIEETMFFYPLIGIINSLVREINN
ncbi:MAG: hypothetical protein NTY07_00130 [Bacteroidia bacterium]|nr:hypothetical protein [Bacteroidia bacterium]